MPMQIEVLIEETKYIYSGAVLFPAEAADNIEEYLSFFVQSTEADRSGCVISPEMSSYLTAYDVSVFNSLSVPYGLNSMSPLDSYANE